MVIGNAISRGNPELEYVLDQKIPYRSLPETIQEFFLPGHDSLVVAGTHGKTTTTSLLAWIFQVAGRRPDFLIGGVAENFGKSYGLGGGKEFIVEGDEYDSAFFDKGPKFLHYRPDDLIVTSLEFDHADIYADLAAIELQFRRLVNLVPRRGRIVCWGESATVRGVVAKAFCPVETYGFGGDNVLDRWRSWSSWKAPRNFASRARAKNAPASTANGGATQCAERARGHRHRRWPRHRARIHRRGTGTFRGVARRMQIRGEAGGVTVVDDFAHHPTAIRATIEAARTRWPGGGCGWRLSRARTPCGGASSKNDSRGARSGGRRRAGRRKQRATAFRRGAAFARARDRTRARGRASRRGAPVGRRNRGISGRASRARAISYWCSRTAVSTDYATSSSPCSRREQRLHRPTAREPDARRGPRKRVRRGTDPPFANIAKDGAPAFRCHSERSEESLLFLLPVPLRICTCLCTFRGRARAGHDSLRRFAGASRAAPVSRHHDRAGRAGRAGQRDGADAGMGCAVPDSRLRRSRHAISAPDAAGNSLPVRRLDKSRGASRRTEVARAARPEPRRAPKFASSTCSLWDEPGPFDTQLNSDHAFINLAMILCYLPQRRGEDDAVHFADVPRDWRTAVELRQQKAEPSGTTYPYDAPNFIAPNFIAPNYDALVDAPVEIGQFEEWSFTGGAQGAGRTIRVVYHGERVDHDALTRMLAQIVNYETTMMGGAPFPEYTFFLHVGRELRRRRNGARQLHGHFSG